MANFVQTITHQADTCGCCAKVRQTFDFVNDEAVGDPVNEILGWSKRCPYHRGMQDSEAYARIVWEMRQINNIEAELIAAASRDQLEDEVYDDGSTGVKLKYEIAVTFSDKMYVTIPGELENLEGSLTPRDDVEYLWQR